MSHRPRLALGAMVLLLSSCAARQQGPPSVRWGVDECSHCHMILGDERFAAVARSEAGEEARFDDLDCLLRWRERRPAGAWQTWVHDAAGRDWLVAETALYTRDADLATPMGSGLRAWASRQAAAATGRPIESWNELRGAGSSPKS